MKEQCSNRIFLIEPSNFGFNSEASTSNHFQNNIQYLTDKEIQEQVLTEFENLKNILIENGIDVTIFKDTQIPIKPDAIFPNNWVSINNNKIIIYPMCNVNRRIEKQQYIIESLQQKTSITEIIDFSHHEKQNLFLEGTGSIVFDHINRLAYAGISERTHQKVLKEVCQLINYTPIPFKAVDEQDRDIYHTNVMMNIAPNFTVACTESIVAGKEEVEKSFLKSGKEIIAISLKQLKQFAGNMLTLKGKDGLLQVMSKNAYNSLTKEQLLAIKKYTKPVVIDISTIETIGGGSVRCMIAEIFS